nr:MAG: ORF1 [TTV-like mini virus]UGV42406.1 MAG: ORF1 [TTV-like mini virus]
MPWWWRRPYQRRRRYWTRRPRGPFRRRVWRRRRRRNYFSGVRKKQKLLYLPLKQWQPQYIRKLTVSCTLPLFITTHSRVGNNMTPYLETIAPHFVPSFGGFSVNQMTLNSLYALFTKGRAWWSQSTEDYPLIRFLGTKVQLFRADNFDYIVCIHNCYPMRSTLETFQACQPSMMLIQKGRKLIRCKKSNNFKKPYKKFFVHPPAQFKNQWFFQKDIGDNPLIMWRASAASFDRVYLASNAISTSVGFTSLNPAMWQMHNWIQPSQTTGYHPKEGVYLYSYSDTTKNWQTVTLSKLIYLGNSNDYQLGEPMGQKAQWAQYMDKKKWGNPFHPLYLSGTQIVLIASKPPNQLTESKEDTTTLQDAGLTTPAEPLLIQCRYNPFADKGAENALYLVNCLTADAQWHEPADPKLITKNLPLWLATWGFIDFQKLSGTAQKVELNYVLGFHTHYINPKDLSIYVPLDDDFLNGNSPYRPRNNITPQDKETWHPKLYFQTRTYNEICACGPYTIKLPINVSAEAHCKLSFLFKVGGCAQPTKDIKNPEDQPTFPIPRNLIAPNSLQSPATNLQNFLWNFDWRRGFLTQKAAKRITSDGIIEDPLFEPTGDLNPEVSPQNSQESDPPAPEKEEEALLLLINQQHRQQQQFKRRILQLLMSNIK